MDQISSSGGLLPSAFLGQAGQAALGKDFQAQILGTSMNLPEDILDIFSNFSSWNVLPSFEELFGAIFGNQNIEFPYNTQPGLMYGIFPGQDDIQNPPWGILMYGVFIDPDDTKQPTPIRPMYGIFPDRPITPDIRMAYGIFH